MPAVYHVLDLILRLARVQWGIKSSVRGNNTELKVGLGRSKEPLLGQHSNSREGNTVFLILPDIVEKASEGIYNAKQKS